MGVVFVQRRKKICHILECKRRKNEGILNKRPQHRKGERKKMGEKWRK
jgi:hypothetical protein